MNARLARTALVLAWAAGCAPPAPQAPPASSTPLHLTPLADVVPAAGLEWLIDARPRALVSDAVLGPAVRAVVPPKRFAAYARSHGGLDLQTASELVVAGYPDTTLVLVKAAVVPEGVGNAFRERGFATAATAPGGVARWIGAIGNRPAEGAVFGHEAVGLGLGSFEPLEAALYFAEGRLRRSAPALRAEPLATVVARTGSWAARSPIRAFAPGPFDASWSRAMGGVLGAATGIGASLTPIQRADDGRGTRVVLTVVVTGAWPGGDGPRGAPGASAKAAAERLAAAFELLAEDPLGRLCGLDRPLEPPRVASEPDALRLDVSLDARALAEGLGVLAGGDIGL